MRSKLQFAVKDFVEKRFTFAHQGAIYSFFSACPSNSEEAFPILEGIERGETHYGVLCISRDASKRIIVDSVMRCDGRLPASNAVLKTLVPAAIKDWTSKLS